MCNVTLNVKERGAECDDEFIATSRLADPQRHITITKRGPVRDVGFIASNSTVTFGGSQT